jgi:hypothetical protein
MSLEVVYRNCAEFPHATACRDCRLRIPCWRAAWVARLVIKRGLHDHRTLSERQGTPDQAGV